MTSAHAANEKSLEYIKKKYSWMREKGNAELARTPQQSVARRENDAQHCTDALMRRGRYGRESLAIDDILSFCSVEHPWHLSPVFLSHDGVEN